MSNSETVRWLHTLSLTDIAEVGVKNAGLGSLIENFKNTGINVPFGFALCGSVYQDYIYHNQLEESIEFLVGAWKSGAKTLSEASMAIRALIMDGQFSDEQKEIIGHAYCELCSLVNERTQALSTCIEKKRPIYEADCAVAVRSSTIVDEWPEVKLATEQESYLNIQGLDALLVASRRLFASLFTESAMSHREAAGIGHLQVSISVGIQAMVRADQACAGVMYTRDKDSGCPDTLLITSAWGLGQGGTGDRVSPDRFMVYKPILNKAYSDPHSPLFMKHKPIIEKNCGDKAEKTVFFDGLALDSRVKRHCVPVEYRKKLTLTDDEILTLARWGTLIEQHYEYPMKIEWAKDGLNGELYLVQIHPETASSNYDHSLLTTYHLTQASRVLLQGASIGNAIASGPVCCVSTPDHPETFPPGCILVTEQTDPDWLPIMRKAAGIITNTGGPTSHAAIISRELKIPAVVGTGTATELLEPGVEVTLSCSEGVVGRVYEGRLNYEAHSQRLEEIPETRTQIMINAALPETALHWWQLPVAGIGLTRMEFIIAERIRIHPMALLYPEEIEDAQEQEKLYQLTQGYTHPKNYFIETLALDVGKIAASRFPDPVIIRMSDFTSNEYRNLIGGKYFELEEENPMLGLRGASRYYSPLYKEGFQLECQAIKHAREIMGFSNIIVMIPFCRTPVEADRVLETMATVGLERGRNGLEVYMMCEVPANVILAEQFAERFDGFSIGSNDLTQLALGIDRDSAELKYLFDTRNEAVRRMIAQVISTAHACGCKVGICGQAPSDHPEFGEFLVQCGIDSISLNPDSVIQVSHHIAAAEQRLWY